MTTTTKMPVYNLDDYTRIQIDNNNGYMLPDQVIESIRTLCSEIGYDINTTKDTYINQHNAGHQHTPSVSGGGESKQFKSRDNRGPPASRAKPDNWKSKSDFKVSKFAVLDGIQEIESEIRSLINKINDTNRDAKTSEICDKIDDLVSESSDDLAENMNKIFNTIYDIIMSNAAMPETYAMLLSTIYSKYTGYVHDGIVSRIDAYKASFKNIVEVDPNQDYDAFCAFTTQNIARKKASAVFATVSKLNTIPVLDATNIQSIIRIMITDVSTSISSKEKQKEVEEATENLITYFTILGELAAPIKAEYMPLFKEITQYKTGEKPGLNARTKFKYMDIVGK
jgi:hypothetical protein